MPIDNANAPITKADLERLLGQRNDGDDVYRKLDKIAQSIETLNAGVNKLESRLSQAEEADRRHEAAVKEYATKVEGLREEIAKLKMETAVDRVKLTTIVSSATLVVASFVSWLVNYIMKVPAAGGSK